MVQFLWNQLGLTEAIQSEPQDRMVTFDVARYVKAMVCNRLMNPSSKLDLFRTIENLPDSDGETWQLQHFSRALDYLMDIKPALEKFIYGRLTNLLNFRLSLVLYDLTSTHVTGHHCSIAKHGYSRTHRLDLEQVELGLLVTSPVSTSTAMKYDAINIVYRSLQEDRDLSDISDIIQKLHGVVDQAITTSDEWIGESTTSYGISKIDFERLRKEFERSSSKNTTVQNLKSVIEKWLRRLLMQNPLRTDFQKHYEEIVEEYNREKDRLTIEKTFEALLHFVDGLNDEESRAMREGMDLGVDTLSQSGYEAFPQQSVRVMESTCWRTVTAAVIAILPQ